MPRPGEKYLGKREFVRTPWDFSLSCFNSYRPDSLKILTQCFELDWGRLRLPRAIKEDEKEELKEYLRPRYKYFRDVYKYLAGVDPQKELMCIGTATFGQFCQEIPNFVDM